jgi:hypothetical protein
MWDSAPHYLVRDRDRIFGSIVRHRLRAMGIRDKPTAPRSLWQNGFAERLIGSVRRECLEQTIVFGEAHLRRLLISPTQAIRTKSERIARFRKTRRWTVPSTGLASLKSRPILGGLRHQYVRI